MKIVDARKVLLQFLAELLDTIRTLSKCSQVINLQYPTFSPILRL